MNRLSHKKNIKQVAVLYLITFFSILTFNFFLPRIMPGDPIAALLGPDSQVSLSIAKETRAELLEYYQLDRPLYQQYISYLRQFLQGKLGWGIYFQQPVGELIKSRLKWSLLLITVSSFFSFLVAIPLAALSVMNRRKTTDTSLLVGCLILLSLPVFLVAMLFVVVFSVKLNWLPLAGAMSEFTKGSSFVFKLKDILWHSVGPITVLSLTEIPVLYLVGRSSMLNAMDQPWMEFALLRGISKKRVFFYYLIPAGLLPIVTRLGIHIAYLLTSTIFVETVFSYPGLGRLLFQAIQVRDYPVLQGVFLIMTMAILGINFLVDASYRFLGPRVTEQ